MSRKPCRRGHRNRSAVSVTRITVDIGHPNQVNPHRCQELPLPEPKATAKCSFSPNPTVTKRSQNRRIPNPSRASIAATQPLKHVKTWKNEVINSTKTEQISRISVNEDDWHAQKLFVNVVDSVDLCMYHHRFMCGRNGFIQAHGFGGWPGGRLRPVRGAIDEVDIGW